MNKGFRSPRTLAITLEKLKFAVSIWDPRGCGQNVGGLPTLFTHVRSPGFTVLLRNFVANCRWVEISNVPEEELAVQIIRSQIVSNEAKMRFERNS